MHALGHACSRRGPPCALYLHRCRMKTLGRKPCQAVEHAFDGSKVVRKISREWECLDRGSTLVLSLSV